MLPIGEHMVDMLAAEGQRVLAVAIGEWRPEMLHLTQEALVGSLTLIGLVGLIESPRPEAIAAVAECHRAGFTGQMITGDHAATARGDMPQ